MRRKYFFCKPNDFSCFLFHKEEDLFWVIFFITRLWKYLQQVHHHFPVRLYRTRQVLLYHLLGFSMLMSTYLFLGTFPNIMYFLLLKYMYVYCQCWWTAKSSYIFF
jgi:hypothetical protein